VRGAAYGRSLTLAQLTVLECAAAGLSAKETAERYSRSEQTIKTHRRHVLAKLDARNMAAAVAQGFRLGILSVDAPSSSPGDDCAARTINRRYTTS